MNFLIQYHTRQVNFFSERVSEWASELLLLNVMWVIFQLPVYHGKNTLYFYKMTMMFSWYYSNTFNWNYIVLNHWNNSQGLNMLLNSNTLPRFWANQSLLFLLNDACLVEKFIVFGLTQCEHARHYITDAVFVWVLSDREDTIWFTHLIMVQSAWSFMATNWLDWKRRGVIKWKIYYFINNWPDISWHANNRIIVKVCF